MGRRRVRVRVRVRNESNGAHPTNRVPKGTISIAELIERVLGFRGWILVGVNFQRALAKRL